MEKEHNINNFLDYKNGILHMDDVPYLDIIKQRQSPTVCVSLDRVEFFYDGNEAILCILNLPQKIFNLVIKKGKPWKNAAVAIL